MKPINTTDFSIVTSLMKIRRSRFLQPFLPYFENILGRTVSLFSGFPSSADIIKSLLLPARDVIDVVFFILLPIWYAPRAFVFEFCYLLFKAWDHFIHGLLFLEVRLTVFEFIL